MTESGYISHMTDAARINIPEWTVSELSAALKRTVEDAYGYVRVRGEVSGFKGASPSGHCYFRLKDDRAVLESVIWKTTFGRLRIKPQEGLEVVVTGRLTTFPGSSKYQIIVETLEPAGLGALMALLEERKKKLNAEGLFDAARKQLLPYLPEVIGVVTSPTGAVIRDILHRLADRFPRHVIVWPVRVQGEDSANEVAAAINGFNALGADGPVARPDLIIVARGGGSLEDLWSFNEEIVVRAAAASMIPLISAVGHETDVTLIDFAADVRAPTPTAAAEMAVPVRTELMVRTDSLARRALACWQRNQEARRTELRAAIRALPRAEDLLAQPRQRLDHAAARLPRALTANAQIHHRQFSGVAGRLGPQLLRARLAGERQRVAACAMRARHCLRVAVERRRDRFAAIADRGERAAFAVIDTHWTRLERASALLTAFSYQGVLERGFALVRAPTGKPLRDAASVNIGMRLDIEFADGRVRATAEARDTSKVRPPPRPRRRRSAGGEGQGSLF